MDQSDLTEQFGLVSSFSDNSGLAGLASRFAGTILIAREENRSIESYFTEYESWERFIPHNSYRRGSFTQVSRDGLQRTYRYYLVILHDEKGEEYFVVTKQVNDLRVLEPFCPCMKCRTSYLNPIKYLRCPYCTRCLRTGPTFTRPEYIEEAKRLRDKEQHGAASRLPDRIQCYELASLFLLGTLGLLLAYSV